MLQPSRECNACSKGSDLPCERGKHRTLRAVNLFRIVDTVSYRTDIDLLLALLTARRSVLKPFKKL